MACFQYHLNTLLFYQKMIVYFWAYKGNSTEKLLKTTNLYTQYILTNRYRLCFENKLHIHTDEHKF